MSKYVNPVLQDMPAGPQTATKPHQEVEAEISAYPVGVLAEIERIADPDKRAQQILLHDIWGIGPRTNALLQSVSEEGIVGLLLESRIGKARPAAEPRPPRPRQPEQHKRRVRVPAQQSLIDIFHEMLPSGDQPVGTAAGSRVA